MATAVLPTPEQNQVRFPGRGVCHVVTVKKGVPLTPQDRKIGECQIAEVTFWLFYSAFFTMDEVAKERRRDIEEAAQSIFGPGFLAVPFEEKVRVVQGAVQLEWYKAMGRDLPARVLQNQEDRVAAAKALLGTPDGPVPARKKASGLKIMDVITSGLIAGHAQDEIIRAVHEQFPGAVTGAKDIAFYRCKLRKEGLLPKFERKPKNPKA